MKNIYALLFLIFLSINCNSQDWVTYTSPANTFKVKFPAKPEVMVMKSGFGVDSTQILQSFPKDNFDASTTNSLSVLYLSDEILKPEFDEEKRLEVLKRYSSTLIQLIGKIVKTEEISLSGYPGLFMEGEITQAINEKPYPPVYLKSYLVDNMIYILKVSSSAENKESPLIEYFFNSFELISK